MLWNETYTLIHKTYKHNEMLNNWYSQSAEINHKQTID